MSDKIGHTLLRRKPGEGWTAIVELKRGNKRFHKQQSLGPRLREARRLFPAQAARFNLMVDAWLSHIEPTTGRDQVSAGERASRLREEYQARPITVGPARLWR